MKPAPGRRRLEGHTDRRAAAVADQKMGSKQQVPDGMLIGPKNPIIEEALGDRRRINQNFTVRFMRGWLQVLNRAALASEAPREKKTISGRTFTRK